MAERTPGKPEAPLKRGDQVRFRKNLEEAVKKALGKQYDAKKVYTITEISPRNDAGGNVAYILAEGETLPILLSVKHLERVKK